MSDLVEFLKARLDEDAAEIAKHPDDEPPDWDLTATAETNYPCFPYIAIGKSRVLAEVEAKRLMLNGLHPSLLDGESTLAIEWGSDPNYSDTLLKLLALPYADHPDYREEWRP